MEGALSKWTNVVKGWQYRWFVLDDNAGLFSYYTSKEKMMRGVRRGCVRLRGAVIGIDDEDDSTFTIKVDGKTFHFQAQDSEERERWIRALEETVLRHNPSRRITSRLKVGSAGSDYKIEDFDRKLAETDRYLQLLLNQISALKTKSSDPALSEESKTSYWSIIEKSITASESIKHAIVLLQIAKNAVVPSESNGSPKMMIDRTAIDVISIKSDEVNEDDASQADDTDVGRSVVKKSSSTLKAWSATSVPEISYSSSEDEDFYDAQDLLSDVDKTEEETTPVKKPPFQKAYNVTEAVSSIPSRKTSADVVASDLTDDAIDYDALYDNTVVDEQDVDMNSHGSVISHLLSQVRIGMDLTKIVLPTFILERRSLLEMYSDFFAHPDIFLSIPDGKTAEDRMIRVLRWYLSSFHAGRKSTIAKKPYNPILGETFRCKWKTDARTPSGAPTPEPPRPWNSSDEVQPEDLIFVAEQVSHHPPISAFYAENVSKRISFNAHIYTKSSFLGMSVAVHNVGQGTVSLLDHDEDYIVTFPSGYGRSILTVPWVELGGKVSIKCPKTGYVAFVEFKTKQFFSSDVNKISAEVHLPNSRKSVVRIDGEWNGKMMAKYANGVSEVFIDVSKIPIHEKNCRKVSEQESFESRRLWKDVTYGLKNGDIEAATAAKFALEQRQREDAQARKEANVAWETKLFHAVGENWFFDDPLAERIVKK